MDIYCPKCCEPWGIDTLHEYAEEMREMFPGEVHSFKSVYRTFLKSGCGQAFNGWKVTCEVDTSDRGLVFAMLGEIMGDDVDGFASSCEDMGGML